MVYPYPWPQRLVLGFNACFLIGLLVVASSLGYGYTKYSRLPRIQVGSVLTSRAGSDAPQNFLLVGGGQRGQPRSQRPCVGGSG